MSIGSTRFLSVAEAAELIPDGATVALTGSGGGIRLIPIGGVGVGV